MSITLYSKYRRMKLKNAWHLAGMCEWCVEVGKYILALFAALVLVSIITDLSDKDDQRIEQAHRANHLENVILSCLNSGGVMLGGELHLCRPVATGVRS